MNTQKKLLALLASGVLMLGVVGAASAAAVTPTEVQGNITVDGEGNSDQVACDAADAVFLNGGDSPETEGTSANGVTVTVTYNEDKSFDFEAEGGLVTIAYVKGSNSYNVYDYVAGLGHGVASDTNLVAPGAGGSGGAAGVSHLIFCTEEVEETEAPTETPFQSVEQDTDAPTETPFQSVEGETDEPSEPDTATVGGSKDLGSPAEGAWLLVVALGVLLSSIVVLTPARAKAPRR